MAATIPGAQAMTARHASAAGMDTASAVLVENSAQMPAATLPKTATSQAIHHRSTCGRCGSSGGRQSRTAE